MFPTTKALSAAAVLAGAVLALTGCASGNPLASSSGTAATGTNSSETITIGSAAFPESEIVAEVYAQALEHGGVHVNRHFNIGQREVYLKALKDGSIDLIPEYSGNLLLYFDKSANAQSSAAVYSELKQKLPARLTALNESQAQDKDSYNVTQKFSRQHHLTSLAGLANIKTPLKMAANPEFATRPEGSQGLKRVYGATVTLVPISDSGGPLTVKSLVDGSVQMADIFTTSPAITADHLVTLKDPKNLILAQNVLPLINSQKASGKVTSILNKVSAALTTADLIEFNTKNGGSAKESPAAIAKEWLASKNL